MQLDENTMDEEGLTPVMDSFAKTVEAGRMHPLTDQGDGHLHSDAWSNPYHLQDGDTFFQIRPKVEQHSSPYFTDADTIEQCRNPNGEIDLTKLFDLLQINPGKAKDWVLSQYKYNSNDDLR